VPEKQWNTIRDRVLQKVLNIAEDEVLNDNNGFLTIPFQAENCALSLQKVMYALLSEERISPSGMVDYQAIREDRAFQFKFIPLTQQFRFFDPNTLITRQEQIAFWINLYNALVLHAVLQQNIQDSVNEGKWRSSAFFQRSAYHLNQLRITADDIEHGILRGNQGHPLVPGKQFAPEDPRHAWVIFPMDPRIHFALHSASKSSPLLRIYQSENIDFQLTQAVNDFLGQHTQIDRVEYTLLLPNLVKWAQKDLGGPDKILELLMQAIPDEAPYLRQHFERWKIKYGPYDWALNQSKPDTLA
jgi:hypothetical protein